MRVHLPRLCVTLPIGTLMTGLALVCDLGQVSVPATPLISLIYLNYKQFDKSGWFVTVIGAVSALVLFLGKIRIAHWGNEVAAGRNGKSLPRSFWSRQKRLQILPMGILCPHFIETYLEEKMYQTYPNLHQVWRTVHFLNTSKEQRGMVDACCLLFTHLKSSLDEA